MRSLASCSSTPFHPASFSTLLDCLPWRPSSREPLLLLLLTWLWSRQRVSSLPGVALSNPLPDPQEQKLIKAYGPIVKKTLADFETEILKKVWLLNNLAYTQQPNIKTTADLTAVKVRPLRPFPGSLFLNTDGSFRSMEKWTMP
jgi:hypothetical protein